MKNKIKISWLLSLLLVTMLMVSGCANTNKSTESTSAAESTSAVETTVQAETEVPGTEAPEAEVSEQNTEVVTFKSKRDTDIPATVVTPKELGDNAHPIVLFSHGFTGSRKGMGTFEQMAAKLAEKGILSIMIDFPGCNESQEPYTNYTITNMSDDMDSAIAYMIETYNVDEENIGLMGHSMGGRMTALKLNDNIKAAALWAPAASPGISGLYDFMSGEESVENLYSEAQKNGKILFTLWGKKKEVDLSLELFEEMKTSDPLESINNYHNNLFVAVALNDESIYKSTTDKVIAAATNVKELKVISVADTTHTFKNVNDEKDLSLQSFVIDETADFLIEHLSK